jgi:hypothetical protein
MAHCDYDEPELWDMTDVLFDTQKMVERLENAGVPAAQACAHIAVLAEAINALGATIGERCASKEDVAKLEADMNFGFEKLRRELTDMKTDLMRWVVTVGILQMALIAALVLKLVG